MLIRVLIVALTLLGLLIGVAGPAQALPEDGAPTSTRGELDSLFGRLKVTKDPAEAVLVENRIEAIWSRSASDTANLLYRRGLIAFRGNDKRLAFDLFSAVTSLQPDFAEAWHQLGAVNFAMDAHDEALVDLERTLRLEPRHFGAMMGLASIFELYGNKRAALSALRRAYAIDPHIDGLQKRINVLSRDVEGQGI